MSAYRGISDLRRRWREVRKVQQQPTSSAAAAVLHRLPPDAPSLYRRRSRCDRSSFTRSQTFCPAKKRPQLAEIETMSQSKRASRLRNWHSDCRDKPIPGDRNRRGHAVPCRAPLGHNQCFVRLCEALHKSGVSFKGCFGSSCQIKGADHAHHFSNPYDFPNWPWPKGKAYVWEAKPPFAPEPMPGLAAFEFVQQRQGIILFTHYFDVKGETSMWGGHIDLWNRRRMGNFYSDPNPEQSEAAFLRSRKISFWPLK